MTFHPYDSLPPYLLLFVDIASGLTTTVFDIGLTPGTNKFYLYTPEWSDTHPAWSPDGRRIAFSSNRAGTWEIFVMNADGSAPVQLTHTPVPKGSPAWSPDGAFIAYHGVSDDTGRRNFDIYVRNAKWQSQSK